MGGTAYFLDALDRLKKNLPMIEDELKRKYLTRTPLTLDVRVILFKVKNNSVCAFEGQWTKIRRLYEPVFFCKSIQILIHFVLSVSKRLQVVSICSLIDCPDLTSTCFPHLFKNTKLGLSATSKKSLESCTKRTKWNILIFVVLLHYALSVYNAFCLENN
jgi:hypothetical protein